MSVLGKLDEISEKLKNGLKADLFEEAAAVLSARAKQLRAMDDPPKPPKPPGEPVDS